MKERTTVLNYFKRLITNNLTLIKTFSKQKTLDKLNSIKFYINSLTELHKIKTYTL